MTLAARPARPSSPLKDALRALSLRDRSSAELEHWLRRRGHAPAPAAEAVERLRAAGYLDDGRFAERLAASRLRGGQGRLRIAQELRRRGVARPAAQAGLRAARGQVTEQEALQAAARRYWRSHPRIEPPRRLRNLALFLLRRGFPAAQVRLQLARLFPRWRGDLPEIGEDLPSLETTAETSYPDGMAGALPHGRARARRPGSDD